MLMYAKEFHLNLLPLSMGYIFALLVVDIFSPSGTCPSLPHSDPELKNGSLGPWSVLKSIVLLISHQ